MIMVRKSTFCQKPKSHVTSLRQLSPSVSKLYTSTHVTNTVKSVLSGHSKIDKTKISLTNVSLMKVESIAECSKGSILQYFWPALSENQSWKPILVFFLSGRFFVRFDCTYPEISLVNFCLFIMFQLSYLLLECLYFILQLSPKGIVCWLKAIYGKTGMIT